MIVPLFFIIFAGITTLSFAILGILAWVGRPRGSGQSGDLRLHAVARDVFIFRGYFSNAVVFVLPERVVLVDTLISPETAELLKAAVARVTPKPITHVILTHYNGDHVGGTTAFPDAELICTEATARLVVERDDERRVYVEAFGLIAHAFPPVATPTRTFSGELMLELDGEVLEIRQLGAVETEDACVVWWPSRRVIAVGDGVSTAGYPYLGAPVVDEGLRDDGQWIGFLAQVQALAPDVLLAGHGPALVGRDRIAARLTLLQQLMTDVMRVAKEERALGGGVDEIVARAELRLTRYARHPELGQNVATQRFAVLRALNSLDPNRRGHGWWWDLRAPLLDATERAWTTDDPAAWGARAEAMLGAVSRCTSVVDGADYFREAGRCARAALEVEASQPGGLVVLGILEVWSAVLLGQPMQRGRALLEQALAGGRLTPMQRRKVMFFMGKSWQYSLDDVQADAYLRQALPRWLRPAWPLLRPRLRSVP